VNSNPRLNLSWLVLGLVLLAAACNMPGSGAAPAPGDSNAPPDQPPAAEFHGAVPVGLPEKRLDHAGDVDSHANANKRAVSGGDVFVQGLYERPFNANTMDTYFPYLDIVDTQGFLDDTWGYATITMANTDSNGALAGQYAVELDLDKNGHGQWLIRVSQPSSTDWSTKGVQAWKDPDGDVGGTVPLTPDEGAPGGDGYETLVFDQGQGDLQDAAWARVDPNDPKTVDLAFKLSMIGNPDSYAMGSWAGSDVNPELFDHNDHMTHVQAGSPNPGYEVYPLKQLAEIDNTCRLAIGFAPTGKEPGLCQTVQQREGDGSPSCPPCESSALLNNCPPCP
jgi:hypothetical protein